MFTAQLLCGSKQILPPFAPPLLSDPLKVDAEAHAVVTNWAMVKLASEINYFKFLKSESLKE